MESLEMLLAQCSRRFLVGIDVIDSSLLFYHGMVYRKTNIKIGMIRWIFC